MSSERGDIEKSELLRIARNAVERALSPDQSAASPGKSITSPDQSAADPGLSIESSIGGAFVTIRNAGKLRGCMGTFTPMGSTSETIEHAATIASRDPRFVKAPILAEELPHLHLELSLLSRLTRVPDASAVQIGTHGIYIRRDKNSGCFLPNVATERQWDAVAFLEN